MLRSLCKSANQGRFGLAIAVVWAAASAAAASGECLTPEPPIGVDAALLAEYRREILADYERFFSESSAFIDCLDETRGQAMADLAVRAAEYEAFFSAAGGR